MNKKLINNYTIPIIFVAILMTIVAFFGDTLLQFGLITGIIISFVVFYYFGKNHDGYLYILSLFLIALAWDLIQPPYMVSPDGIISQTTYFGSASIDYILGTIFSNLFSGILLFYATYVAGFAILFILAVVLGNWAKIKK